MASNITKEVLVRSQGELKSEKLQQKVATDGKRLMAENLGKTHRVWQAFVRFIKSQVQGKRRCVDTGVVGLFTYQDSQFEP